MGSRYFVVGGEYTDTTFQTLADGAKEQNLGPFSEREAIDTWRSLTGKTVDNALVRYFIRAEDEDASKDWYVVGGEYADTTFQKLASGKTLDVHGPFPRKAAMDKWRELTGLTVDSATTRYEIVDGGVLANFKINQ